MQCQVRQDVWAAEGEPSCDQCSGKVICVTECCKKRLCGWHLELDLDDVFIDCADCRSDSVVQVTEDTYRYGERKNVYCKEHNSHGELTLCESHGPAEPHCDLWKCKEHLKEECQWETLQPPELKTG